MLHSVIEKWNTILETSREAKVLANKFLHLKGEVQENRRKVL